MLTRHLLRWSCGELYIQHELAQLFSHHVRCLINVVSAVRLTHIAATLALLIGPQGEVISYTHTNFRNVSGKKTFAD